jgi:glycosyltransferase involved in cell wall biosynthesis
MIFDCIVVGSHLRFDGVWQRPQQVVTRLAERVPVLFIEEAFAAATDRDEVREERGVTIVRPLRRNARASAPADAATLATARAWAGSRRALVWLYTPLMAPLEGLASDGMVVYDCMDELAGFAFAPAAMATREADLTARARLVFAGGKSLYEARRAAGGAKVRLYPSGVEFEHFARARTLPRHPLAAHLEPPVCGYIGAIDERIDFALVEALAARRTHVIMIGPIVKIDAAVLPQRANVHFTGQMPYAELPALLAGFDVAIMPFARNAATTFISPTKTPEYLAAGRPVVSSPIADVVASYGDVVTIAASPQEFADACLAVQSDPAREARASERARAAGWDAIVARMWSDLERE